MLKAAVSACLLGKTCRFDGASKPCSQLTALLDKYGCKVLPVCPEQAGGLPTPRPRNELVAGVPSVRVIDEEGQDNTQAFMQGAHAVCKAVQDAGCSVAVLKSKSPSCGSGLVYDGTFSGTLVKGYGVTARLLREHGILVLNENELDHLENLLQKSCFFLYVVECADGTWYTGYTTDIAARLRAHNAGEGAKYTRSRCPVRLIAQASFPTKHEALSAEYHFKHLTRKQKEQLLNAATTRPFADVLCDIMPEQAPLKDFSSLDNS